MRQITFISGHYGSGKTEFAINLSIQKKIDYLIDGDIINPYFRSREHKELLEKHHIKVISSPLDKALGSDLPYISKDFYLPFQEKTKKAIFDLGGSATGARIVRQITEKITEEIDHLCCINIYRPETANIEGIKDTILSIEEASGLKVTGLINNSNYLRETHIDDVIRAEIILKQVSQELSLPIVYTALIDLLNEKHHPFLGEVIKMKLYLRNLWL